MKNSTDISKYIIVRDAKARSMPFRYIQWEGRVEGS